MDDINAKPKNNYPLEEIQRNDFAKKPDIKLSGKMYQDKKVLNLPKIGIFLCLCKLAWKCALSR